MMIISGWILCHHRDGVLTREDLDLVGGVWHDVLAVDFDYLERVAVDGEQEIGLAGDGNKADAVSFRTLDCDHRKGDSGPVDRAPLAIDDGGVGERDTTGGEGWRRITVPVERLRGIYFVDLSLYIPFSNGHNGGFIINYFETHERPHR